MTVLATQLQSHLLYNEIDTITRKPGENGESIIAKCSFVMNIKLNVCSEISPKHDADVIGKATTFRFRDFFHHKITVEYGFARNFTC